MTTTFIQVDPIEVAFATRGTVLITGEPGVGKTWRARDIAERHAPNRCPIVMDCAGIHAETFEATVFGYARGAFTGAVRDTKGFVEAADRGVLIIDEVGEVPLHLQTRLLRVLQDREIVRMGETRPRRVDVVVIACTNRDLLAGVEAGWFREDLYSRLISGAHIWIPPLSARPESIPSIVHQLAADLAADLDLEPVEISEEAAAVLAAYRWPYNVRSLEAAVRGLLAYGRGDVAAAHAAARAVLKLSDETPAVVIPDEGIATGRGRDPLAIVELLGDRGREFTRAEYEEVAEVSGATARRDLSALIDYGVVEMVSGGRTACYTLSAHEQKESAHEQKESAHEQNTDSEEGRR